jgi:hypothetical protein
MTVCGVKTEMGNEKTAVEVRRKRREMPDFAAE